MRAILLFSIILLLSCNNSNQSEVKEPQSSDFISLEIYNLCIEANEKGDTTKLIKADSLLKILCLNFDNSQDCKDASKTIQETKKYFKIN